MTTGMDHFLHLWSEISDLVAAQELLSWDQDTMMPTGGQEGRAHLAATLAGLWHRALTSTELSDTLEALLASETEEIARKQLDEARWHQERATRMPEDLVRRIAAASSTGVATWQTARAESDFRIFAPALEEMLDLKQQQAEAIGGGNEPYDALLDEYEPGMTAAHLERVFATLTRRLPELLREVVDSGVQIDESPVRGDFSEEGQLEFGRWAAALLGFDIDRGRIDRSAHPFCCGLNRGDVRLTWRPGSGDFRPGFFGIMHEVGHALYEQGLPEEWSRTPLGAAASLGIHESQSRLWENHVGRHPAFWRGALPRFKELFPQADGVSVDDLWPAFHKIEPSLIRVEADEVTYNLHILARFEIERSLLSGDLLVVDLPGAWAEVYDRLLGRRPDNDNEGVLQDIHWAAGLFGYFPTYCLGSLLSAQLFAAAEGDLGSLEKQFEQLDFAPLLGWLREKIHRHGCRYTAAEITERATGRALSSEAFLSYVEDKAHRLYGIARSTDV